MYQKEPSMFRNVRQSREKENTFENYNIAPHNVPSSSTPHLSPLEDPLSKSLVSGQQTTHPKTSTDNLHTHRLESMILSLQSTLSQQQYQLETLTSESTYFMALCEEQKGQLLGLNLEGRKMEYEEQISELLSERNKIQEIITQLKEDYDEVYAKEEEELNAMKKENTIISQKIEEELERKKSLINVGVIKDKELHELEVDERELEERLDELRNVERKLNIAIRELKGLRETRKQNKFVSFDIAPAVIGEESFQSPEKKGRNCQESDKGSIRRSSNNKNIHERSNKSFKSREGSLKKGECF